MRRRTFVGLAFGAILSTAAAKLGVLRDELGERIRLRPHRRPAAFFELQGETADGTWRTISRRPATLEVAKNGATIRNDACISFGPVDAAYRRLRLSLTLTDARPLALLRVSSYKPLHAGDQFQIRTGGVKLRTG